MYIDVYFVINWVLNGWILSCTVIPLGVRRTRIWIASAVGALGGCLWELAGPSELWRPVIILALSALMLFLSIGIRPRKQWMTAFFKFYAYSFFMAGLIPVASRYIPLWLGCIVVSYGGLKAFLRLTESRRKREVQLRIRKENQTWELRAMIDSGNLLREPIHGKPVIVIREDCLENRPQAGWPVLYQTIQGEGLMLGFWPESIWLEDRVFREGEVLVGLSKTWKAQGYQALVPESIMK